MSQHLRELSVADASGSLKRTCRPLRPRVEPGRDFHLRNSEPGRPPWRPGVVCAFRKGFFLLPIVLALTAGTALAQPAPKAESTVGMPGRLEALVLPGSELEAKPLIDRRSPVVLRIVQVYPHGTAFRYDLEYSGLDPGPHDLRQYLQRKDGSPLGELPPIPVQVNPVLPPGQIEPNTLVIEPGPRVGGYWVIVMLGVVVWGLGLVAIIASFFFPRRRTRAVVLARPVSLADRLRPLVQGAIAGTLSQGELAGLERALLAYWRKRLKLEDADPGEALVAMRRHPKAGPLLEQLEAWLHRPGSQASVNLPALLAPYRALAPDEIDLTGVTSGKAVGP